MSFHVFASQDDDCHLWVSRVGRKGLPKTKVSKNSVLCSQHFFGGKKTKHRPHPIKCAHGTFPLWRKMPSKRAADEEDIRPAKKSKTAEGQFSSSLTLRELSQNALAAHHAALTAAIAKQHHSPLFTHLSFSSNSAKFSFYTGLPSHNVFNYLIEYLRPQLSTLYLPRGNEIHADVVTHQKFGRQRSKSAEDEIFPTLVFLCHALKEEMLADMFGLSSKSQVSSILTTWIPFLSFELEPLLRWPSRTSVASNHPPSFKHDHECCKCHVIIDCFEVELQKPSSLSVNTMTL